MYQVTRNKSSFNSPQLGSVGHPNSIRRCESDILSTSTHLPIQYAIIPEMNQMVNEMNQILYLIEKEKLKIPYNINLIQFYINLHLQKLHEFGIRIPLLPIYHMPFIRNYNHNNNDYFEYQIPPSKVHKNHHDNFSADSIESIPSNNSHQFVDEYDRSNSGQSISILIKEESLRRTYSKQSMTSSTSLSRSISKQSRQSSNSHTVSPIFHRHDTYPISHNNSCQSIQECRSIINIIKALVFYQKYQRYHGDNDNDDNDNDNNDDDDEKEIDLKDYFLNKYTNFINDYHHILRQHLDRDTESNNDQFELINNEICKYIVCDINKCEQYKRHERNRESKINNGYFINHNEDSLVAIYTDILDTVHCTFLHSFDTGFRIKSKDQQQIITENHCDHSDDDNINQSLWHDVSMKNLRKYLENKRRNLRNISGLSRRIKHYKFCTPDTDNNDDNDNNDNNDDRREYFDDTASIASLASLASIASTVNSYTSSKSLSESFRENVNTYSFGHRYYYWRFYCKNNEKDPFNHGYTYSYWYIKNRHINIKDEILHSNIHRLNILKYNIAYNKAKILLQSDAFKAMKCDTGFFEDKYEIKKNDKITIHHIISLILYTDFDILCYEFSKTFRKKYHSETNESLKKRNSNFANFSRLLRESIECFGEKMKNTKIKILYHGVSHMVLSNLICKFCGPTSTTPQIEVATLFSKSNGIILELEKYSNNLRYFNCSLLSCYGNEDERLFLGGFHELNIRSIREIKDGVELNYRYFIRALSIFSQVIDGKRHIRIEKILKRDYRILDKLLKHQLASISIIDGIDNEIYSNKFPVYINTCFQQLVRSKKKIKINLYWLNRCYPGFKDTFIDPKCNNLVLFDVVGSVFYCCTEITVNMDQFDVERNITISYLTNLVLILKRLNNIYHAKLRKIKIKGIKQTFSKQELIAKQFIFNTINWKLEIQKHPRKDEANILLTNLNMKKSASFRCNK